MLHVVDDFAAPGIIEAAINTWLPRQSGHWHFYENGKMATKSYEGISVASRMLITKMAELDIFGITGMSEAFPDVEYLHGAGLHQMQPGGSLGLHLDAHRHPSLPWTRVASCVLFLDDCIGGNLEMCNADGSVSRSVPPKKNRLACFSTEGQWHRVSQCASTRRTVCLFFWRKEESNQGPDRAVFV